MNWRHCFAALILCLVSTSSWGQSTYRLRAGDRIELWASQEPTLRRQVAVGPDGWISIPLVGHVNAMGLTVLDLEKVIVDKLRGYFKENLELTVMLQPDADRVPMIYLVGEVSNPGAYPFRPGMTVLHGVSVAGGLYRTSLLASDEDRLVVVQGQIKQARGRIDELRSQIARVNAELNGSASIAGDAAIGSMIVREQEILEARMAERSIRDRARIEARRLARAGRDALNLQSMTIQQRIEIARQRLQSTSQLVSKGFANASQRLELQAEIAALEGDLREQEAANATVQSAAVTEEARLDGLNQELRTQLLHELTTAQREEATTRASLAEYERILTIYEKASTARPEGRSQGAFYTLVRQIDGRPTETPVTEMTAIEEGDLVRVEFSIPTSGLGSDKAGVQAAEASPE